MFQRLESRSREVPDVLVPEVLQEISKDLNQDVLPKIFQDVAAEVLPEIVKEILPQELHNQLIFTIVNDIKELESLSDIKLNFIKLKDTMFNCKNRVILMGARKACRHILHLLAKDVTLFDWTNKNNGDLVLTNNCED